MTNLASEVLFVPAHVPEQRVVDFDIRTDSLFQGDPQSGLHALKAKGPIFFTPRTGGHWVVTDGAATSEVFTRTDVFSADTPLDGSPEQPVKSYPMNLDPPEHRAYRRLVDAVLTPKSAKSIETEIRELAIELIEHVRPIGACEFLSEVAEPFPVTIFLRLAGLPQEKLHHFRALAKAMLHGATPDERMAAVMEIASYLSEVIEARRGAPGEDILSGLLTAEVDQKPLDPQILMSMILTIFNGGLDTVLNALTFIMNFLGRHPDHRMALREDPAAIPHALEELMRRFCMVSSFRKVTRDEPFHGVELKAGDRVWASTVMLGMDDKQFACPAQVDFSRRNIRNPIFGTGPHLCPGRHLARLEMQIFLEEWLKRIPEFEVAEDAKLHVLTGNSMGFDALPLRWAPTTTTVSG